MSTDPVPVTVAALRLSDPVQVGPHRLLGRLGGGGMGVVYLADGPLGQVAIKIIRSELAENPSFRVRFQRELQACFRVRGRHTAKLLDFDITAEPPWIATEFLAAATLEQHINRHGPLDAADQGRLAAGLADALVSIHTPGLIHRDLKPSNVMWTANGPVVIDFGVAAVRDAGQLTVTGTVIGTPGWLSPELVTGGEIGAASDLFAWGGLVCYAATGVPPYGQGPAEAVAYRIVHEQPRVDYTRIAEPLREVVRRTLAREPGDRPTAEALRAELVDILGPDILPPSPAAPAADSAAAPRQTGTAPGVVAGDVAAQAPGAVPHTVQTPSPSGSPPPSWPSPAVPGLPAPAGAGDVTASGTSPWNLSGVATPGPTGQVPGASPPGGSPRPRRRRRAVIAGAIAAVVLVAGVVTAVLLTGGGNGDDGGSGGDTAASDGFTYTATGPWRLMISDRQSGNDTGCTLTPRAGANPPGVTAPGTVYGTATYQVHLTGEFHLDVDHPAPDCVVEALPGGGAATLPFTASNNGDSSAFQPPAAVNVEVRDFNGGESCELTLRDVTSGVDIDVATATPDAPTVRLDSGARDQVYLAANDCVVRISAVA
ncbi:serine/threonine-protein kinase [Frankia sp. AgB32]|uniref:serine/threonine-protein kinase n=1 Tax=Frankia sp. AgB32 TaxID=631119 RepID=UPI002010BC14|nr:serine/threonine-protein kinase [Frankia sp. AgB32]MCK9897179.1 serine/threonine protein kinase [Frankia sp. AgB32]